MEKICIVRRRENVSNERRGSSFHPPVGNDVMHGEGDYIFETPDEGSDKALSLRLTPEQTELLQTSDYMKNYMDNEVNRFVLNMQKEDGGQTVFNFHFDEQGAVKLLKTKDVCDMLQVSTTFLMKLVKEKKIKSYKLGRLRRFSLNDILTYLTDNNEI